MMDPIGAVPIPASIKDITPDWVKKVTGHDAIPDDFHIEADIQEGVGFLSSICRVSFKTRTGDKHSIIVKLLPPSDSKWRDFLMADSSDEREIQFYSIVLPDLVEVVPEIQENIGLFYKGAVIPADPALNRDRSSMLVMEDLKASGFGMMDFAGDGSDHVMNNLMTFLARFHFGALAIEIKKGIPLPELYPFMQGATENAAFTSHMESMIDQSYPDLDKLLSTQNVAKEVFTRYSKLKPFTKTIVKKLDENGSLTPCMVHGDLWPPNILVHGDHLPVKILDWQLLGFRDVTFDIATLLYTVLPKDKLTTDNLRRLLKCYYDKFEQLCKEKKKFGDKIKRRSWEELEKFFFTWATVFIYVLCVVSIEAMGKDCSKYANVFRVLCEENNVPEFLLGCCT